MQISRCRPGEEPALYDVYHSAIHLVARRNYLPEQVNAWAPERPDLERWVKRIQGINPFVAEIDHAPVGYADVQTQGYIDHFFVSGRHPRQGIGRALMETITGEAARLGLTELTSDVSLTAQPFFERFGFSVVEHRRPLVRGVVVPNALMRKVL